LREQLRSGLNSLPAPRNDYEIVVPESEEEMETPVEAGNSVEDQADVDARYIAELKAKRKQDTSSVFIFANRCIHFKYECTIEDTSQDEQKGEIVTLWSL
jgi:pre-mRNA-splicing factor CDC5/CEF1